MFYRNGDDGQLRKKNAKGEKNVQRGYELLHQYRIGEG